jgi:ADP-L-glycero-D-manno-heptose 6-epimerase
MIILTGGAGMIGSMIAWHLNTILNENKFVIVDDIKNKVQEKNISKRKFIEYIKKKDFEKFIKNKHKISAIIHMGAISSTTETNFNNLLSSNIRFSQMLWHLSAKYKIPFIYASSAATYGNGKNGYIDDESILTKLCPLNPYGYSKHFFDQWIQNEIKNNQLTPPQWCGLKFFNVYGPNEYHKNKMASVVFHAFEQIQEKSEINLFKSYHPDYKDGMQLRDFIYVKDAVDIVMFFLKNNNISGLFNVGTGHAGSFKELAEEVINNTKKEHSIIKYIDMPNDLKEKYQYYTQANLDKIRSVGFNQKLKGLKEGVADYVQNYLLQNDRNA